MALGAGTRCQRRPGDGEPGEEGRRLGSPSRGLSGCRLRAGPTHADAVTCRSRHCRERFGPNREGRAPALIPSHSAAALVGPSADRTPVALHSQRRWGAREAFVARVSHTLRSLALGQVRGSDDPQAHIFEDRGRCSADHVGWRPVATAGEGGADPTSGLRRSWPGPGRLMEGLSRAAP